MYFLCDNFKYACYKSKLLENTVTYVYVKNFFFYIYITLYYMVIVLDSKAFIYFPRNLQIYGIQNTLCWKFCYVNLHEYLRVVMQIYVSPPPNNSHIINISFRIISRTLNLVDCKNNMNPKVFFFFNFHYYKINNG